VFCIIATQSIYRSLSANRDVLAGQNQAKSLKDTVKSLIRGISLILQTLVLVKQVQNHLFLCFHSRPKLVVKWGNGGNFPHSPNLQDLTNQIAVLYAVAVL
jgi:hypothetical protein